MTRLDTEHFRRAYWVLLWAKKIKVIFQYFSQTKQVSSKSLWSEWSYERFQIHFFCEGKKIKTKRKHSFLHKITSSTWTKCWFLDLQKKSKQKRKARALRTPPFLTILRLKRLTGMWVNLVLLLPLLEERWLPSPNLQSVLWVSSPNKCISSPGSFKATNNSRKTKTTFFSKVTICQYIYMALPQSRTESSKYHSSSVLNVYF